MLGTFMQLSEFFFAMIVEQILNGWIYIHCTVEKPSYIYLCFDIHAIIVM